MRVRSPKYLPHRIASSSSIDGNTTESIFITPSITHNDITGIIPHAEHKVASQVPLIIIIKNINNFSAFNNFLTKITSASGFKCNLTSAHLIVRPRDRSNFNKIVDHLNKTNACYHTFVLRSMRLFRIVIINL